MRTFYFIAICLIAIFIINFFLRKYILGRKNYHYVGSLENKANNQTGKVAKLGFLIIFIGILYINFIGDFDKSETKDIYNKSTISDEEIQKLLNEPIVRTKEDVEKLLSNWNGSLPTLVNLTKKNLNNPDSFEHVETGYINKGDYIQIKMVYRAQNGFGAIIKSSTTAKVNFNGDVIEIIN